jgi:hypothetical protein
LVDILGAGLDALLIVLAVGIAYVAFTLKRIFAGGIFERAWLMIGLSPIVYAVGRVFALLQALDVYPDLTELAKGVVEVVFLLMLLYGFYKFASSWRPGARKPKSE